MNLKMTITQEKITTRSPVIDMAVKCHNRPPFLDSYETHGVDRDGKVFITVIKNVMSKSCKLDSKLIQPGCQGCRWQLEDDPRDLVPQP